PSISSDFAKVIVGSGNAAKAIVGGSNITLQITSDAPFTARWLGGTGSWDDPTQWSAGKTPGSVDKAIISSGNPKVPLRLIFQLRKLHLNGGTLSGVEHEPVG